MIQIVGQEHRTVARVTRILEAVARDSQPVRLTDLAKMLNAPKSSVHGLAKGLVAAGYLVEHDATYSLGPAVEALLISPRRSLLDAARPAMLKLQEEWDETVSLCALVGESVVYVDCVESTQSIRYSAPLRTRRPLFPTSAGKCFLAWMSEGRLDDYLSDFPQSQRNVIRKELKEVRERMLGYNMGQTVLEVTAVASPILVNGAPLACLAVAGPTARMLDKLPDVSQSLLAVTRITAARLA